MSNASLLLAHERAFDHGHTAFEEIEEAYERVCGEKMLTLVVTDDDLTVDEAVHSYFFNSQIVSLPDGSMAIIAPTETQNLYEGKAASLLEHIRQDAGNPVSQIHYADLRQSMRNGGGPACLRLRVVMTGEQLEALGDTANVLVDDALLEKLEDVIYRYYPESITAEDLGNPALLHASAQAIAAFGEALGVALPGAQAA